MLRWKRLTKGVTRKILGLFLAASGISLVVKILPGYIWFMVIGLLLIWLGWNLYQMDIC